MSLACSEVKLLHEVVLDHLKPVQAVLDLLVNLRALEMVPKDSPYLKTYGSHGSISYISYISYIGEKISYNPIGGPKASKPLIFCQAI